MKNKFPRIDPTPEDSQIMNTLANRAKEIVGEDEGKMEQLTHTAREILERAAHESEQGKNESAFAEFNNATDSEREEESLMLKTIRERLLDDKSDFYTNEDRGFIGEIFFKTLMEEIPDLGLSIEEEATDMHGRPAKGLVTIKTIPHKTDREFIHNLGELPIISVLRYPEKMSKEERKDLEKKGLLPKGTTDRALARRYLDFAGPEMDSFWKKALEEEGLANVSPLSDGEAREIMAKVIREEYTKKL